MAGCQRRGLAAGAARQGIGSRRLERFRGQVDGAQETELIYPGAATRRPALRSRPRGAAMSASVTAVVRRPLAIRLSYDERSAFLFIAPLAIVLFAVAVFPI